MLILPYTQYAPNLQSKTAVAKSELLLFLEEEAETDDRAVNQQSAYNAHSHGFHSYQVAVCQYHRKCYYVKLASAHIIAR